MFIKIGWRNLWRRRKRTLFTASAMGLGMGLSMTIIALQSGIASELFNEMVTDTLGHLQAHHPKYTEKRQLHMTIKGVEAQLSQLRADPGVSLATSRIFSFALAGGQERSTGALVTGVDPKNEALLSEMDQEVKVGRWLSESPNQEVVLGLDLAEELSLKEGDELALIGQDLYGGVANALYRVVGLVSSGSVEQDRAGVWIHLKDAQDLLALEDQAHQLLIIGQEGNWGPSGTPRSYNPKRAEDLNALKARLLEEGNLSGTHVESWREANPATSTLMDAQESGGYLMLVIVFIVAALGILNTMLMSVFERTRELGVLLALGIAPMRIFGLVISEALLLGTVAAFFGLLIGGIGDALLLTVGVDFSMEGGEGLSYNGVRLSPILYGEFEIVWVWRSLIALFSVTLITALWPAWRASRVEPIIAMKERV